MGGKPKFTPGPWAAGLVTDGDLNRLEDEAVVTAGEGEEPATEINIRGENANECAFLIAAAPDLYAIAAGILIYQVEDDDRFYLSVGGQIIAALLPGQYDAEIAALLQFEARRSAALAKARGEAV